MANTPISEMNFEIAMAELEKVVAQLESSQVALEDSIKLYDRGAELKKHCEKKLAEAEEKIAQIALESGKPEGLIPFEG
ncbi:MAG: exodeoxyribonuclease VII small subunit [Rhodobacteraceae bacterium]|jgi:exodeoxyribonuclease VII small subunit|nr:exodeoxyribonuclease VII small subunit [Paracoccaceae bacterium]|tara:strand:+ start:403 stop:639 length:237 start_codon:yes stop_codon:yes gene_type:complete